MHPVSIYNCCVTNKIKWYFKKETKKERLKVYDRDISIVPTDYLSVSITLYAYIT